MPYRRLLAISENQTVVDLPGHTGKVMLLSWGLDDHVTLKIETYIQKSIMLLYRFFKVCVSVSL